MAMTIDLARRLALALGLTLAASAASAQDSGPPPGVSYGVTADQGASPDAGAPESLRDGDGNPRAPEGARQRRRAEFAPYLEVAAGISSEFGGDTLTYSTVAAGVDGRIETRRVTAVLSYRYDRNIELSGDIPDQDSHSGVALVNVQVARGVQFDAGALATRTGGQGRAFGVTEQDDTVEVYSAYAGPTVATHAGPVAINGSYRLGYTAIDDDSVAGGTADGYDSSLSHSATASVGMAPGQLPFGWTVGGGYVRSDSDSEFEDRFEGQYVRGDVVVPVGPTLALTAGVGYERIRSSQNDLVRDAGGIPVLNPQGRPVADPNAPRLLTYDVDGLIYDGGVIWRPTPRTELQARAGHRYGGTTVVGSLSHRFNNSYGLGAVVYDSVETFGTSLSNDLSSLPDDFQAVRNPLTGDLAACGFGATPGSGRCIDRSLQSIRGQTFRARGGSIVFSGSRNLWSFGAGASYDNRRYQRPNDPAFALLGSGREENYSLFASVGRQLSRTSDVNLSAYASWFDGNQTGIDRIFSTGATASYSRRFLLDRLQLQAALGINHSDDGVEDSTIASGLAGLRYTFW